MLKQDFDADQDEDNAAEYLRFALEQRAEAFAEEGGNQREQQGGQSDDAARREDLHLKQRKADADSKSVDAGRNGLGDNGAERKVDVTFFLLRMNRFPNHLAADESKQQKGNPVVKRRDQRREGSAQKVAQQRHQSLEQAEHCRPHKGVAEKTVFVTVTGNAHAVGHRNRKGVHRKSHRNHQQV